MARGRPVGPWRPMDSVRGLIGYGDPRIMRFSEKARAQPPGRPILPALTQTTAAGPLAILIDGSRRGSQQCRRARFTSHYLLRSMILAQVTNLTAHLRLWIW